MKRIILIMLWLSFMPPAYGQTNWRIAAQSTQRGLYLYKKGEYRQALPEFLKAYQLTRHPLRLQNVAKCYEKLRQYPLAITYYIEYVLRDYKIITSVNRWLTSMIIPYLEGQESLSNQKINHWLTEIARKNLSHKFPVINAVTAITFLKNGQLDKAGDLLVKILPLLKQDHFGQSIGQYIYKAGLFRFQSQEYPKAKAYFSLLLVVDSSQGDRVAQAYVQLALQFKAKGRYKESLSYYQEALAFARTMAFKNRIHQAMTSILNFLRTQAEAKERAQAMLRAQREALIKSSQRQKKKQQIAGWTMLGVGIAALGTSIVMFILAENADRAAKSNYQKHLESIPQEDIDKYYALYQKDTKTYNNYMISGWITSGIALVGLAVAVTLLVVSHKKRSQKMALKGHRSVFEQYRFGFQTIKSPEGKMSGGVLAFSWSM